MKKKMGLSNFIKVTPDPTPGDKASVAMIKPTTAWWRLPLKKRAHAQL
jgi:hypothetical protein